MGTSTSRIISEIFLKIIEKQYFHITRRNKITLLAQYVDDILVIYDSVTSNENDILNDLNSIHNKIKFTYKIEISQ